MREIQKYNKFNDAIFSKLNTLLSFIKNNALFRTLCRTSRSAPVDLSKNITIFSKSFSIKHIGDTTEQQFSDHETN